MTAVRLESLSKRFGPDTPAVRDLTLSVAEGELLTLIGPSGSGKTTTLRLIAGLERPDAGRIRLGDRDVTGLAPWHRGVAVVFQRPALYPHLSVRDNLLAGVRIGAGPFRRLKLPADEPEATARQLGLTPELLRRRPGELSGGQQQRVALGRALLRNPAVLLLDEPLAGLEPPLRAELRRELHLLQRRRRVTMIHVTHDPQEALALADRLAVLERGRLVQTGTPANLCARPATRFVAAFCHPLPLTLLDGVCESGRLRLGGLELPAPVTLSPGRVQVAVPPEAVRLVTDGFVGEVLLVENLPGRGWLVTVSAGPARWTALCERQPPRAGQQVRVEIDWHLARWFDAASGTTLEAPRGV